MADLSHLAVFRAHLAVSLAVQVQYRAWQLVWLLWFVLKPLMYLSVWRAVAQDNGGTVAAYALADVAAYFLVTMWVIHLTFNGAPAFFEGRLRRGEFSPLLLRPTHPIWGDVADNLTYKALTAPFLALATLLLAVTYQPRLAPPPWSVAAFVPALALAFVLRFVNTWTVALASFWVTRMQAVWIAYLSVLLFLTGEAAPLAALPGWAQTAAYLSPFPSMLAFPTDLLLGRLTPGQALGGLGAQLLWTAASVAALVPAWRAAVGRYSAVGG